MAVSGYSQLQAALSVALMTSLVQGSKSSEKHTPKARGPEEVSKEAAKARGFRHAQQTKFERGMRAKNKVCPVDSFLQWSDAESRSCRSTSAPDAHVTLHTTQTVKKAPELATVTKSVRTSFFKDFSRLPHSPKHLFDMRSTGGIKNWQNAEVIIVGDIHGSVTKISAMELGGALQANNNNVAVLVEGLPAKHSQYSRTGLGDVPVEGVELDWDGAKVLESQMTALKQRITADTDITDDLIAELQILNDKGMERNHDFATAINSALAKGKKVVISIGRHHINDDLLARIQSEKVVALRPKGTEMLTGEQASKLDLYVEKANRLQDQGRFKDVIKLSDELEAGKYDRTTVAHLRAGSYANLGDRVNALKYATEAYKYDPYDKTIQYLVTQYQKKGIIRFLHSNQQFSRAKLPTIQKELKGLVASLRKIKNYKEHLVGSGGVEGLAQIESHIATFTWSKEF